MIIPRGSIAKEVFGSPLKMKILEFLSSNQIPVSERELARMLKVSHVAVNKTMKQLLEFNIVKANSIGTAMVWEINEKSFAYPYVKSFVEAIKISPLEYVKKIIREKIESKNAEYVKTRGTTMVQGVYIFGSIPEQTARTDSDIDILVVLAPGAEKNEDRLKNELNSEIGFTILQETGNRVSFHVYSVKSVQRNRPSWLLHAINNGIRV
ncbi:nucleotidyltransferase domain-containing protein [Candidatus Micrarchaeota archaeon]|nr:nucleotidyltransferase domain-containing protein [Candidatus Micrarchaeota archaeon]